MGVFNFKRFSVVNDRSAMKVNTDGVLLGAAMTIYPSDRRFLDVGTGTGTIALMAAQRIADMNIPDVKIDAVEIDEDSSREAGMNFANSPWNGMFSIHNLPFDDFAGGDTGLYDLVFSNPPYFDLSLLAPSERRCNARHTSAGLSFKELLDFASDRLSPQGRISMVLPADQEASLCRHARMCGLHLFNIVRVRTVPRKQPCRIIAEFSRKRCASPCERSLIIQNEGKYSEEYLSLTHDFYLFA
ncbi:MAG: tRNA1(Val) (adenine(37)-N6)-methyltransferase [Candidatus Cryptobacteroides sp.]